MYMGVSAIAEKSGLTVNTIKSYIFKGMLPEPDAIIHSPSGQIRGWEETTIDQWLRGRARGRVDSSPAQSIESVKEEGVQ
jgi:hypothetical protein